MTTNRPGPDGLGFWRPKASHYSLLVGIGEPSRTRGPVASPTALNLGGLLFSEGPKPLYVIGAIVNGALLVVAVLTLRRERR